LRRWRMFRRDRQIDVTDRAVGGIPPPLNDGVLQRPRKLALELHARQPIPVRRRRCGPRGRPRLNLLRERRPARQQGGQQHKSRAYTQERARGLVCQNSMPSPTRPTCSLPPLLP
jgi:hypothetical protein